MNKEDYMSHLRATINHQSQKIAMQERNLLKIHNEKVALHHKLLFAKSSLEEILNFLKTCDFCKEKPVKEEIQKVYGYLRELKKEEGNDSKDKE